MHRGKISSWFAINAASPVTSQPRVVTSPRARRDITTTRDCDVTARCCDVTAAAAAAAALLTCEVAEAQLAEAVVAVTPVVEEDGEGVATLVQLGAPHDAQVLQRQVVELVQRHQDVAGHLPDGLGTEERGG